MHSHSHPQTGRHTPLTFQLIRCSHCGTVAYDGDRYCARCGTQLQLKCAECEAPVMHPIAFFCTQCGAALPTAMSEVTDAQYETQL